MATGGELTDETTEPLVGGRSEPVSERHEPVGGRSEPVDGRSELVGGQSEPVGGRSEPVGGRSELVGGRSELVGGRSELVGGRSEPVVGQSELVGGQSEPVGGRSELVGGRSEPVGDCAERLVLTKPLFENGCFKNPWDTWTANSLKGLFKFITGRENRDAPKQEEVNRTLPVMKPNFEEFGAGIENGVRYLWLGHASTVVNVDGVTVLTDPVFSSRCFAVQFMGPKRYRQPPCGIEDLPQIDIVVISHNHYDHLDIDSVRALNRRFGKDLRWYVPMGLGKWMVDRGCGNVVELTWWDEDVLPGRSDVKVVCTPTQHWSKRTLMDTNKTLWCSWAVIGPNHNYFFAGDTGYCSGFKQIGRKYGPFSLAAIPIGCFRPT